MAEFQIPFGEWLPDRADFENPGLIEAKNVIPTEAGYAPLRGPGTREIDVTPSEIVNLAYPLVSQSSTGDAYAITSGYNGSSTNLRLIHRPASSTWTTVDTQSAVGIGSINSVAQFDDKVIVSSGASAYQIDLSTSGTFSALTTPNSGAIVLAAPNKFLMLGELTSTTLHWSAFNDFDDFTVDSRTQAGSASLDTPRLGPITNIISGKSTIVFQQSGVTRLDYVGPPLVWADTLISSEFGCVGPNAAVAHGGSVYFLSHQGFCVTDGASVQRIGEGKVDRWLFEENDGFGPSSTVPGYPIATIDHDLELIYWTFDFGDNTVIYSMRTNSFSRSDSDSGLRFSTINNRPQEERQFTLKNGSVFLVEDGDALAAEMTTGHASLNTGGRTEVDAFEPIYTGSGATVAASSKQTINGAATVTDYAAQNAIGVCNVRASGRSLAASVRFPAGADWDEFAGVIANPTAAGSR